MAIGNPFGLAHTVSVGVHLGIAFGGTGWPVKLNYGFTGRFGESTAAFARLEGFGIDRELVGRETPMGPIPTSLRPIFRDRDDFKKMVTQLEKK